jgi:opacity protein-like surface antigen
MPNEDLKKKVNSGFKPEQPKIGTKFDVGASANKRGYALNAGVSFPISKNLSVGVSGFKGKQDGQNFGGKQLNATLTIPLNKKKKK